MAVLEYLRKVLEKRMFFRLSWNSGILIKMSWNSIGPWNLVFYGSLPACDQFAFFFVFYALGPYTGLFKNWNSERGHMNK